MAGWVAAITLSSSVSPPRAGWVPIATKIRSCICVPEASRPNGRPVINDEDGRSRPEEIEAAFDGYSIGSRIDAKGDGRYDWTVMKTCRRDASTY